MTAKTRANLKLNPLTGTQFADGQAVPGEQFVHIADSMAYQTEMDNVSATVNAIVSSNGLFTAINNGSGETGTVWTVDSTTGFLAGMTIIYVLNDGTLKTNTIASVDSATQITVSTSESGTLADNAIVAAVAPGIANAAMMQIYNVKVYGAKGDGSTDDTTAIQAAITAAGNNGGGIVFFPRGTYYTGTITLTLPTHKGVQLVGVAAGPRYYSGRDNNGSILLAKTDIGGPVLKIDGSAASGDDTYAGIAIDHLRIDGNRGNTSNSNQTVSATSCHGLQITGAKDVEVRRLQVQGCAGKGLYVGSSLCNSLRFGYVDIHNCSDEGLDTTNAGDSFWNEIVLAGNASGASTAASYACIIGSGNSIRHLRAYLCKKTSVAITGTENKINVLHANDSDSDGVLLSGHRNLIDLVFVNNNGVDAGDAGTSTFTADASTDVITMATASQFDTYESVQVTTTATLPAPLSSASVYYITMLTSTTAKLSTSLANAQAGTYIDITDAGSGTHTVRQRNYATSSEVGIKINGDHNIINQLHGSNHSDGSYGATQQYHLYINAGAVGNQVRAVQWTDNALTQNAFIANATPSAQKSGNVVHQKETYHLFQGTFTADASTDLLTISSGSITQGNFDDYMPVRLRNTGGGLPGGLSTATTYYIIPVSGTTCKLATSRANAIVGTYIDITSAGTGTHTATQAENYTPQVWRGKLHVFPQVEANFSILAPDNNSYSMGDRLAFLIPVDGTSRTISWNATYNRNAATTTASANTYNYVEFVYDGSKWVEVFARWGYTP